MRRAGEPYDAIVVGGGIAGLTCAAYLSRSGLNPLLLERQQHVGGLINSFEHEGFVFDSGARAFESSGILIPMLLQLGIDLPLKRSEVSIIIADRRVRLEDADSLDEYAAMLKSAFPDSHSDVDLIVAEIRRVMGYLDILYGIDNPLFAEDMKDKAYLKGELLPWFKKFIRNSPQISRLNGPVNKHLRKFTTNEALINMIAQHFFRDTPTFFALSYFSLYLDYIYPEGGTGSLPEAMSAYIKEHGGEIRTLIEVTSVDAARHELSLADGSRLSYKKLIWAADQSAFYNLTQSDSPKFLRQKKLVESSHGADSILTLFIGLDQSKEYIASHSGAHAFYTPETIGLDSLPDWTELPEAAFSENALWDWLSRYLELSTYEISCPVLRDPQLAPVGQSGLVVSALVDYGLTRQFESQGQYEAFKDFCSEKIIDVLEQLYPGLRAAIKFTICATPTSIERINRSKEGAITGWAFTNPKMPAEMSMLKISKSVRTPLPDIFQCGQWVFSPSGIPTCILTGKLAADQVSK